VLDSVAIHKKCSLSWDFQRLGPEAILAADIYAQVRETKENAQFKKKNQNRGPQKGMDNLN